MRALVLVVIAVAVAPPPAVLGQQPNREALRRQVVERFIRNFRTQAALSPDQSARFEESLQRWFRERRQIEQRQRQLVVALEGQLRPGVAADQDSVVAVLDRLTESRRELVDLAERYDAEFATYLDPVQRGQLVLQLERFQRAIENVVRRGQPDNRRPRD